jgi:hypothetical protein
MTNDPGRIDLEATEGATAESDRSSDAGGDAARSKQADLTQSVGHRLTRESAEDAAPRWKRWLRRG